MLKTEAGLIDDKKAKTRILPWHPARHRWIWLKNSLVPLNNSYCDSEWSVSREEQTGQIRKPSPKMLESFSNHPRVAEPHRSKAGNKAEPAEAESSVWATSKGWLCPRNGMLLLGIWEGTGSRLLNNKFVPLSAVSSPLLPDICSHSWSSRARWRAGTSSAMSLLLLATICLASTCYPNLANSTISRAAIKGQEGLWQYLTRPKQCEPLVLDVQLCIQKSEALRVLLCVADHLRWPSMVPGLW